MLLRVDSKRACQDTINTRPVYVAFSPGRQDAQILTKEPATSASRSAEKFHRPQWSGTGNRKMASTSENQNDEQKNQSLAHVASFGYEGDKCKCPR